jgi:hypothetical protein
MQQFHRYLIKLVANLFFCEKTVQPRTKAVYNVAINTSSQGSSMNRPSKFSKVKQLASLTAAGASAIALTGAKAEATVISSGPLNVAVGFTADFVASGPHNVAASHLFKTFQTGGLTSGPRFAVRATSFGKNNGFSGSSFSAGRAAYARGLNTQWENKRVSLGAQWTIGTGGSKGQFGNRTWGAAMTHSRTVPPYNFTHHSSTSGLPAVQDAFMLFRFPAATPSGFIYGWVEYALQVSNVWGGPNPGPTYTALHGNGPNVTILQYAFDTSGNLIGAGNGLGAAGDPATPEPTTLAETGLAALVLGAEGLRRWRKHKTA